MNGVIEIRAPGVPIERRPLPGAASMLGRSPVADIPVPTARELADEHLIISPNPTGCHLALLPGVDLVPTLRGRPFRQSEVVWGDEVVLGRTTLRFIGERPSQGPNKLVLAAVVVATMVGAWFFTTSREQGQGASKRPTPPALFAETEPCRVASVAASAHARQAEQEADTRTQRYRFDALDGVKAVRLYMLASSCYSVAGDGVGAARTLKAVEDWRRQVESAYRNHDMQLRLALDRDDTKRARSELRQLHQFVRDRAGPYINWLAGLRKQFGR
jgi:hypothetical protein